MYLHTGFTVIQRTHHSTIGTHQWTNYICNGKISATGNITVGSITTTGNITGNVGSFRWLKCTASSGRPLTPTTYGAYLGNDGTYYSALELVCDTRGYIDITSPNVDSKARMAYNIPSQYWWWAVGTTEKMILTATTLTVNGSAVSSDKRLKFNKNH
ncbi:MAG: hypothetical protein ACKPKO_26485 [Candidatus Fonsibacter sp.]